MLLDLDGTLADTGPDLHYALRLTCEDEAIDCPPYADVRPHITGGSPILLALAFAITPDHPTYPDRRARFLKHYANNIARHTTMMPGMDECLHRLDRAQAKWGIVTNKSAHLTHQLLDAMRLTDRAHCIVAGDTLSESKPHSAPLLHGCALMDRDPTHGVYVGDAPTDIDAARAAGMRAIAVRYGYIPPDHDIEQWGADAIVDDVPALMDWLVSRRFVE
ncbi:MAG: HAD-IA family hydrolase [Pseudomonadota bacterium]